MLEIEMKFRAPDAQAYERLLKETLGVVLGEPTTERDIFFTNETLGFPNEGKSLRIRRRGNYLAATFKGPRLDTLTKTREELELPLIDEAPEVSAENDARVERARQDWSKFYNRLGFSVYGEVVKTRRRALAEYGGYDVEITFDEVEGLGAFTELEITAEPERLEEARAALFTLAHKLGLSETIAQSYLGMVFAKDRLVREFDAR